MPRAIILLMFGSLALAVTPASAQNWSFDARHIALGGLTGGNQAATMLREQRDYRAVVVPLGLFQVLSDFDRFRPDSNEFDLVRMVEYASSPLHYIPGRDDGSSSGRQLFVDLRNATLSRDLSDYRGIGLSNQPAAGGIATASWGATIPVARTGQGAVHSLYLGAGPYVAMRSSSAIDPRVVDILGSEQPLRFPNDQFVLDNATDGQIALAVTGGYRGRLPTASMSAGEGIYVYANYHYLHGIRYEDVQSSLRLDTDADGLLTSVTGAGSPLRLARTSATSGRGFAVDLGAAVVVDRWEAGVAIRGIGNRITWEDADATTYTMSDLFAGDGEFVESDPLPIGDVRIDLPVDYRVHGGYHAGAWTAIGGYAHGLQGDSFRGGVEYRLRLVELRGGGAYSREMWQPTGGVGINLGPRLAVDVAAFGTSANAPRTRRAGIAVSLRLSAR